jgi:hypothetical protein
MSRDLLIMNLERPLVPLKELPKDFLPLPMGTVEEVRQRIIECIPELDWIEPTRAELKADGFYMIINMLRNRTCHQDTKT